MAATTRYRAGSGPLLFETERFNLCRMNRQNMFIFACNYVFLNLHTSVNHLLKTENLFLFFATYGSANVGCSFCLVLLLHVCTY